MKLVFDTEAKTTFKLVAPQDSDRCPVLCEKSRSASKPKANL